MSVQITPRWALISSAVANSPWRGWASHIRLQLTWNHPLTPKTSALRASTALHKMTAECTRPECNWSRLSSVFTEVNVYRPLSNTSASAFQDKTNYSFFCIYIHCFKWMIHHNGSNSSFSERNHPFFFRKKLI